MLGRRWMTGIINNWQVLGCLSQSRTSCKCVIFFITFLLNQRRSWCKRVLQLLLLNTSRSSRKCVLSPPLSSCIKAGHNVNMFFSPPLFLSLPLFSLSLSLFSMSGISCYCTSLFPVCNIVMTCCSQINNFCFQSMGISWIVNMCCLVALLFCSVQF